jgi:hypothetical protein
VVVKFGKDIVTNEPVFFIPNLTGLLAVGSEMLKDPKTTKATLRKVLTREFGGCIDKI